MSSIENGPRKVGKDTVISTLYRLYDESLVVEIKGTNDGAIDKKYSSDDFENSKEAYTAISDICKKIANLNDSDKAFSEQYQEIKTSGTYMYADDGSEELTLTPGGTKIYITYTYE